jgi:eukaryotic-like serine/threonine-protein kinase
MPDGVIGSFVDRRYKVVSRLGSGGMADVYLAEDEQLGRKIALKLLHRRFAEDPDFVERFRREAQAAAGLQHPNVVGVYDRGGYDGTYYIAMEYVAGRTLKQLIRDEAPLDPVRAIDVTIQVLKAARFAHRHGVIHRDLKPQNVMVDESDQAKVTDFGIARAGASDMTETGSILGTAQYLSPEQAQGHAVSASTDLYSIAVMLYEMLTRRVPFEGDQAVTIAIKHVSEAPAVPTAVNPHVPLELEHVVMWALNKNPADRPADADQFIAALEHAKAVIISGQPGQRTTSMAAVAAAGAAGAAAAGVIPGLAEAKSGSGMPPPSVEAVRTDGEGPPPEERAGPPGRRGRNWLWALVAAVVLAGAGVAAYLLTRPTQVVVPPVVGEQFAVARQQLLNKAFQVHQLNTTSNHPVGYVFGENPNGGTKADKGSTVTLTVSTGPGNTSVPAVEGEPQDAARRAIQQAHLKVGQVRQQSSNEVADGNVINTSPTAGQTVPINTSVEMFVSSGKPTVNVPDVRGQPEGSARAALQAAGLQATTSTQSNSSVLAGNVISQDPAGGTEASSGSTVSLVISTGPAKTTTSPTTANVPVPSVTGDKPGEATSALRAAGFKVNQTTKNVTDQSKAGMVVSQSPSGSAAKGSTVTITVGKFRPPTRTTTTTAPTTTP